MNFSWNEQIGTFDAGMLISGQPYNTDGAFVMLKCYNDADELQIFGDIFEEFSIGSINYHAMTSMRISADFLGEQYSGNWGTHVIDDNAPNGGSLRGTSLNGAIFYGVMVDGTAGTVGIVAPTPTGTDSQDVSYTQKAGVSGEFYIVMEAYEPWRPGIATSTEYHSLAELEDLEPLATYTHNFTLDDLSCNGTYSGEGGSESGSTYKWYSNGLTAEEAERIKKTPARFIKNILIPLFITKIFFCKFR